MEAMSRWLLFKRDGVDQPFSAKSLQLLFLVIVAVITVIVVASSSH